MAELEAGGVQPAKSAIKDILYGSAAGIVSKFFEFPFDTVKTRLQSQSVDQPLKFKGPWDCAKQTAVQEGFFGLYRGISMPVMGAMAENATLFVVYNQSTALLTRLFPAEKPDQLRLGIMATAAGLAGAAASFVLTPVELLKCKLQVSAISANANGMGTMLLLKRVLARDGIKGLWLGQTGTAIRETGGSAAWFSTFETMARYFVQRRRDRGQTDAKKGDLAAWELMTAGACAGVTYNCVLFPADSIKSAIQTEDELGRGGPRKSFLQTGKSIYQSRGLRGLYAGCGVTALRSAPSSAIIFYIYSRLESTFG